MKIERISSLLVLLLLSPVLLSMGCGSDGSTDQPGAADGGGGTMGESLLECASAAYCSSWWIVGTRVDALPPATGGDVESGTYVLNDAVAVEAAWSGDLREVLVIEDDSYRSTLDSGLGRFTTKGNSITFHEQEDCSYLGESYGKGDSQRSYEYLVDGNALILFDDESRSVSGTTIRIGLVFTRHTGDLCEVSGAATCSIDDCFCASARGGELQENQCGL